MMKVYLHWEDYIGGEVVIPRRAPYATVEYALVQAKHDISLGHPVVREIRADDNEDGSPGEILHTAEEITAMGTYDEERVAALQAQIDAIKGGVVDV